MGNVSDQIEALTKWILAAARERKATLAGIKADAGRMLSEFSRERAASATRLRSELSADRRARAADVKKLRQGFHRDHDRLAKKQRDALTAECHTRTRAVAKLMDDFKISRGEMAQELTESLRKFAQRLQSQVSSLRQDFREDIQAAHLIWNDLSVARAGGFQMGEAEEKVTVGETVRTVGDAVRRLVTKRGKSKEE